MPAQIDEQYQEIPQYVPEGLPATAPVVAPAPASQPIQTSGFTYMGPKEGYEAAWSKYQAENPAYRNYTPGTYAGPNAMAFRQYQAAHPVDPVQEAMSRLAARANTMPIEQARKATETAQKYLAVVGMKKDAEAGMPWHEVWAKWGPSMVLGTEVNLGQVAQMTRAMTPRPDFKFVPGQGNQPSTYQSPGQRPVIVPRERKTALQALMEESGGGQTQTAPVIPPTASPRIAAPAANVQKTVIRTTKDGRKAVFDADTKQFLRYAD